MTNKPKLPLYLTIYNIFFVIILFVVAFFIFTLFYGVVPPLAGIGILKEISNIGKDFSDTPDDMMILLSVTVPILVLLLHIAILNYKMIKGGTRALVTLFLLWVFFNFSLFSVIG